MASVLDFIECPNCKSEAVCDYYYKTGEEYTSCNNCGYHRSATIKNREKRLDQLIESDWKITELKTPYGAYRLKTHNDIGVQCGSLKNKKQYDQLKSTIINDVEIEFCSVSRFINNKIVEEMIINNSSNSNLNNELPR